MPSKQNSSQVHINDEVDLAELWSIIWAGKFIIIIISSLFAISSYFYAKSLPDIYKASILLAPAQSESGGLGGLAGQFGGLASLAGVNLGSSSDKTTLALEIIKSRSFIENFISRHNLLVPLIAAKGWNRKENQLIIDNELYDENKEIWVRDVSFPKKPRPSLWEAYKEFSELLVVSQDKTTTMVTISIDYYSPELAKKWLTALIANTNDFIREQEKIEAENSIKYLTHQLKKINISSMETVFYQLIEEQSKNMMLTQVKKEYVLKTIDPAQVPDLKVGPKRALIIILAILLGGILSVLFVLTRHFTKSNPSK